MEGFLLALALHAGIQHTHVEKDDGQPDGYGPRIELEAELRPVRWLSLALVGAYASYSSDNLYDGTDQAYYAVHETDISPGIRLYVKPHPRVFLGVTLWAESEYERTTGLTPSPTHEWIRWLAPELDAGGNVARIGPYNVQVMASLSVSDRFGVLEQVTTWSVSLGLQRLLAPRRFPTGGQVR